MFRKRHPAAGARPGTLVINHHSPAPVIRVMEYTPEALQEHDISNVEDIRRFLDGSGIAWIDVQGFGDEALIRAIGELFKLHPLALEDVVNVPQRPKVESYGDQLLVITRMAMPGETEELLTEQVGLVLGRKFLLTFQERHGDVLDPVRQRLRQGLGRPIRNSGPDYLAYAIIDAIIDGYYPILESFGEHLEALETEIINAPEAALIGEIHTTKRNLLEVRRAMWPQREYINTLIRDCPESISDPVRTFLRDCYDHCVQIIDVTETYRELCGSLMDVYLSSISNRQNEVMKVLTIMASIFIPLTFLAGIYGMNFENMPELHAASAYPMLLGVMLLIALVMVLYFRRKGWIGSAARGPTDRSDART